jgi:hypothetical protein
MKWNQESGSPLPTVEMEKTCKMPKCQNFGISESAHRCQRWKWKKHAKCLNAKIWHF